MTLKTKQFIIGFLGIVFLASLVLVQWMETIRRQEEAGLVAKHVSIPASSTSCVDCHGKLSPGIIDHWRDSTHAQKGVGCVECHQAAKEDVDGFTHYGAHIATVVTPNDCARCHKKEAEEFANSHHAKAGNILASLDNFLAETVEGSRVPFNPHSPTPGRPDITEVNGMASAFVGCQQCHGSKVALQGKDGSLITVDDLQPDLVITDMMMPKMGGFPILEHLRTLEKPPRVIMITANEGGRHKAYAEMLGVDDYLRKPFAMDVLLEAVQRALGETRSDRLKAEGRPKKAARKKTT